MNSRASPEPGFRPCGAGNFPADIKKVRRLMKLSRKSMLHIIAFTLMAASFNLLTSCMKKESFSDIPQIAFLSYYNIFDTGHIAKRGILSITFQDGNGDIGLNSWDVNPPFDTGSIYYYNYYIDYYEKRHGTFVKVQLTPPFNTRIPDLTPDDPNKAIKGIIVDTLLLNPWPVYDTIQFSMYIYDRALNKSNVVTTPEIIVRRP
jgi:hypothetical protein